MTGVAASAALLLNLARSRSPEARERLMQGLAMVCDLPEAGASARAQGLISDIFMILVADAERDIRTRLAEQISSARWAPTALINQLALDDIEIARPVIARSPVLMDPDLLRILVVASLEHQIEVARRPEISADVVRAILDKGEPAILTALAGNETASVDGAAMRELVAASRQIASLRSPLARHPRLTSELAYVLYTWVADALRQELSQRFTLDPATLKLAMGAATRSAFTEPGADVVVAPDLDRQEMETRLIAKLQTAGQLRPGFLLKSLREGKLYLFELALASLDNLRTADIRTAATSDRPELLALACAAAGIDRSAFPTMLSLIRGLNEGRTTGDADSLRAINTAFTHKTAEEALAAFLAGLDQLTPDAATPRRDRA